MMAPTTPECLPYYFGVVTFDSAPSGMQINLATNLWLGVASKVDSNEPEFAFKKVGPAEYELYKGMPFNPILVGHLKSGKITVQGINYDLKERRRSSFSKMLAFRPKATDTKVVKSPFTDGREYVWRHTTDGSTFSCSIFLEDVTSKEDLISTCAHTKPEVVDVLVFSPVITKNLEYWLLSMLDYRVAIAQLHPDFRDLLRC